MTTTDEQSTAAHAAPDAGADAAAATAAAAANPALVGVPTFVVGSVCLGLYLVGFTGASSTVAIALVPILIFANGLGLLLATVWAIRLGQGPVASIFGIFAGFWLSFPLLVLGLAHGWFGDATEAAVATNAQVAFLLTWLIGVIVLTVATLRLPSVFTVLFVLIDIALLLVMLGTAQGSTGLLFVGGIAVFAFALVGVYLFVDAMGQATGGKPMPMGKPIIG
ncbi:GPR1/FUN34/YaaH family transporter [Actinomycetospora sp. CA-101289]|uniref:GPR1/FUN34/YaaH family transporter n=1 Tax=Actinomycetospora sp. CA-101289 TaxID=3239893 RepID=UPI003D951ED7